MYKLALFLILLTSTTFSQTVPKSHHPYDPSIDGSFVVDGTINAKVDGNYLYTKDSLTLFGESTATLDPHWVWDVVHKPTGVGKYSFSLKVGNVEYPLAEFFVDSANLYVVKLSRGVRVATSTFWPEGSKISHWQIGQYLAAIVPINNLALPRCASLVVRVGSGVTVNLITVVTQKPQPCIEQKLCIYPSQDLVRDRFAQDNLVFITRFPNIHRVFGLSYLRAISRSRHQVDMLDSYSVALQFSALLYPPKMVSDFYDTSIMNYADYDTLLPDYSVRHVLYGYLSARPSSATHSYFGNMLVHVVESSRQYCK